MLTTVFGSMKKALFFIALFIFVVYSVFPIFWMILSSFRSPATVVSDMRLWPKEPTLENYLSIYKFINYSEQYLNSAIVATVVTILTMVICTFVAYAIARRKF